MVLPAKNERVIQALTRSTVRRDELGCPGSDTALLRSILMSDADGEFVECLASFSKMLRLMDALFNGSEFSEGFVEKFSALWLSLRTAYADDLGPQFQRLERFYGDIQFFCASERERSEEPLLFGHDRLRALTKTAYDDLLQWWLERLASR